MKEIEGPDCEEGVEITTESSVETETHIVKIENSLLEQINQKLDLLIQIQQDKDIEKN